jgi:hypothetical protein
MADQKQFKRLPAIYRKISQINAQTDIRVRLLGRVIGVSDGTLVIDDGSGRADIVAEEFDVQENETVRVFARVLALESGFELRAELVQKMDKLDTGLYEKVFFGNLKN